MKLQLLLVPVDGKPGAAVRKYVHEVQLQEHLDNMRATQQQLSPGRPPLPVIISLICLPQQQCTIISVTPKTLCG